MKTSREIMEEVYTMHEIDKLSRENTDNLYLLKRKILLFRMRIATNVVALSRYHKFCIKIDALRTHFQGHYLDFDNQ